MNPLELSGFLNARTGRGNQPIRAEAVVTPGGLRGALLEHFLAEQADDVAAGDSHSLSLSLCVCGLKSNDGVERP